MRRWEYLNSSKLRRLTGRSDSTTTRVSKIQAWQWVETSQGRRRQAARLLQDACDVVRLSGMTPTPGIDGSVRRKDNFNMDWCACVCRSQA
jgi:hypothetical protein